MATDYISREAAIKALRKRQCEGCPAFPRFCEACKTAGDKQEIKNIPAADVRPVVHGEWRGEYNECSICGRAMSELIDAWSYFGVGLDDVRFCPWCGAIME